MSRQADLRRLNVVAGILKDATGRVLISERVGDGPFHGLWEFPGGKIDPEESAEAALSRELIEELGVEPTESAHFMSLEHSYPDRHVSIAFYLVTGWRSDPEGLEGQQLRWVKADELDAAELLPADLPVVEALRR
ncbi:MAG: 8-oxo-dGTP diphosphatase MutT [Woeseiaceae bacterium]|nr:8-oxo-dGTP diphosphatase MutT [Woeseiaceae bacterium]